MQVINLTSELITIIDNNNYPLTSIPSSGHATCVVTKQQMQTYNGIPIVKTRYGKIENLPDPDPNLEIMYIVEPEVARAVKDIRVDILVADELTQIKNNKFYRTLRQI